MKASTVGRQAEKAVADHLLSQGYKIIAKNWRTKICEIDVIAKGQNVIYLVEVKYRSAATQGSGFEYIGPNKLRQLKFAASVWAQSSGWEGDIRLVGAAVAGIDFSTIELVEIG